MLTFIDFFAGIGGFRRGMELAGHKCVGFCEFDKFAVASYTAMHLMTEEEREYIAALPKNKRAAEAGKEEYRHGEWYANDIRRIFAEDIPRADCWCFGFPCQDISVAGKQLGFKGQRSSLFFRVIRLIQDLEEKDRPTYLFIENVKNLLSVNGGTDFLKLLIAMDESGYDAEWQVINSADYVPQNRERVFIIGHLRGRGTQQVFPVERADGENTVLQVGNFTPTKKRKNPNHGRIYDSNGIAPCLLGGDGGNLEPSIALPYFCDMSYGAGLDLHDKAFCLQSRYHKGICGRARETSGVAVIAKVSKSQDGKIFDTNGISKCLLGGHGNSPKIAIPVLTPDRETKRQNGRRCKENGDPMFTLTGQDRHGVIVQVGRGYNKGGLHKVAPPLTSSAYQNNNFVLLFADGLYLNVSKEFSRRPLKSVSRCLKGEKHDAGVLIGLADGGFAYGIWYEKYGCYVAIRKLTPKECFRLQGWEDTYFERAALVNSESQLYKQAGNGVTVPVIRAIAERMG